MNDLSYLPLAQEVEIRRREFDVLEDWDIRVDAGAELKGQCFVNVERKILVIFGWTFGEQRPEDYVMHEMLHAVMKLVRHDEDREEVAIRDICRFLFGPVR